MSTPALLQKFLTIMTEDHPPAFFLNKQFDVYKFAQSLFKNIEDKRSAVTAITREQAKALVQNNLQFSNVKHESRINALYRLIGLPSNTDLGNNVDLNDANNKPLTSKDELEKSLLQREYQQLELTFKQFLQSSSLQELNTKLDSTQQDVQQLIAELFDPNYLQRHTARLFPVVQYDKIQSVVEARNRIAPSFASNEERYVNNILTQPPFLESVITIRLLQQSGGTQINTQGAVEDAILQSLAYALAELAKQYHRNQTEAEKHLIDGIALIRGKVNGVSAASVKKADINANTREDDGIKTEIDVRSQYTQDQLKLYDAVISLLPTENDIIPSGIDVNNVPFQTRNIRDNALTSSFIDIINSNVSAIQRSMTNTKKIMQKRQTTQDKLTAELGSIIGAIGGISLAEIIIVISALFVLDEEELVGLISKSRFDQLIAATNSNTSTSTSGGNSNAQKQINIFDILKQFKNDSDQASPGKRTPTLIALRTLQDTIEAIYDGFVGQLKTAHMVPGA